MLYLNDDQMTTLDQQHRTQFEQRLFTHGRTHLPKRCAHLDDAQLRRAVTAAVDKARDLGLRTELAVSLYFNVAVCFGLDFSNNANVPWAYPIQPLPGEPLDPVWMMRVSEIASLTLKQQAR